MDAPQKFERIVEGMRYSVEDAELLADDAYYDGSNFERNGRNLFLYRTKNGRYFTVRRTMWQGEQDTLTPVSPEEAQALYEEDLSEHEVAFADAFPHVDVVDA